MTKVGGEPIAFWIIFAICLIVIILVPDGPKPMEKIKRTKDALKKFLLLS
jgi:hypothetical protein